VANGAYVGTNGDDAKNSGYFSSRSAIDGSDAFGEEERLERQRRKSQADSHTEHYIAEQLHRIQTGESPAVFEDEFEAQLD